MPYWYISIKASPSSDAWIYVLDTLVVHWNPKSKQPKVINILARLHIDITLIFLFFSGITQGFVQAYFTNLSNGMRGHDQFKNKAAYRVAGLGLGIGRKS